jgi:hypothetical protein
MWAARYWNPRYWAARYWAKGFGTTPTTALVHHSDWARHIRTGVPAGGAGIAVRDHATDTLSTLFEDDGITLLANPFTAEPVTGIYGWSAANGRYDETITPLAGDGPAYTNPDILLYAP